MPFHIHTQKENSITVFAVLTISASFVTLTTKRNGQVYSHFAHRFIVLSPHNKTLPSRDSECIEEDYWNCKYSIPIYVFLLSALPILLIANISHLCPLLHSPTQTLTHTHFMVSSFKRNQHIKSTKPPLHCTLTTSIIQGVLIIAELLSVDSTTLLIHSDRWRHPFCSV